jgi:hypothetical protein
LTLLFVYPKVAAVFLFLVVLGVFRPYVRSRVRVWKLYVTSFNKVTVFLLLCARLVAEQAKAQKETGEGDASEMFRASLVLLQVSCVCCLLQFVVLVGMFLWSLTEGAKVEQREVVRVERKRKAAVEAVRKREVEMVPQQRTSGGGGGGGEKNTGNGTSLVDNPLHTAVRRKSPKKKQEALLLGKTAGAGEGAGPGDASAAKLLAYCKTPKVGAVSKKKREGRQPKKKEKKTEEKEEKKVEKEVEEQRVTKTASIPKPLTVSAMFDMAGSPIEEEASLLVKEEQEHKSDAAVDVPLVIGCGAEEVPATSVLDGVLDGEPLEPSDVSDHPWVVRFDEAHGGYYRVNTITGESVWEVDKDKDSGPGSGMEEKGSDGGEGDFEGGSTDNDEGDDLEDDLEATDDFHSPPLSWSNVLDDSPASSLSRPIMEEAEDAEDAEDAGDMEEAVDAETVGMKGNRKTSNKASSSRANAGGAKTPAREPSVAYEDGLRTLRARLRRLHENGGGGAGGEGGEGGEGGSEGQQTALSKLLVSARGDWVEVLDDDGSLLGSEFVGRLVYYNQASHETRFSRPRGWVRSMANATNKYISSRVTGVTGGGTTTALTEIGSSSPKSTAKSSGKGGRSNGTGGRYSVML